MTTDAHSLKISMANQSFSEDWRVVPDTTVVTRHLDGSPASLFQDDTWNIDAYGINDRLRTLNFRDLVHVDAEPKLAAASIIQTKQVFYFLIHHVSDDVPAPASLSAKISCVRTFSRFASLHQKTLYAAFEDTPVVLSYILQDGFERKAQLLHSILVKLHWLGKAKTGVEVPLGKLHSPMLKRFQERAVSAQHAVIPTRIYQYFLAHCEMELGLVENAVDDLVQVIRCVYSREPIPATAPPALEATLTYFGRTLRVPSLSGLVKEIALLCEILVIAFTGMRGQEARNLPFNCLNVFRQHGVEHYAIEGVTTKLTGGRVKRACWVTGHLAVRAVKVAQKVLGEAHARFGRSEYITSTDSSHLLFCKPSILGKQYMLGRGGSNCASYFDAFRQRAFVRIQANDVAELKLIDPFRAWDDEPKFMTGEIWPFTRHQLRRTLALYAQRSGLVTLPSLKRQLMHITMEMTMYYARGSAFAKGIFATKKGHFAKEWEETQGMSQYLAYAAQVLFSEDQLSGGHAAWAKSSSVKLSPVSVYSRAETLEMFEKGQLAYKETVLGGCTSTTRCESSPLNWLPLECLASNCKNMVLMLTKLRRVIKAQEKRVEALRKMRPDSVEYRIETDVLAALRVAEGKVCASEGGRQ